MSNRNERGNNPVTFTVTNHVAGLSLDCNANNDLLTADTLGSLIKVLQEKGILDGTTTA